MARRTQDLNTVPAAAQNIKLVIGDRDGARLGIILRQRNGQIHAALAIQATTAFRGGSNTKIVLPSSESAMAVGFSKGRSPLLKRARS
jgi:hypothetical protein